MRKKGVLISLIGFVFIACVILCLCLLFSIKQVESVYTVSTFADTSFDGQPSYVETIDKILAKYKGKSLVSLNTNDIKKQLSGFTYINVESVERKYPNKIVVKMPERKEVYAVKNAEGEFFVLNEYGLILSKKATNVNNIDGKQNVLLEDFTIEKAVVGEVIQFKESSYFNTLSILADVVGKIRDSVKTVSFDTVTAQYDICDFEFELFSGAKILIYDAQELTKEKMEIALEALENADDNNKSTGTIAVIKLDNGQLQAQWSGNI